MQPESDLNPYAAPQSDVTPPGETETPMKRPASTKWVLGLLWFVILFSVADEFIDHRRGGPEPFSRFNSLRAVAGTSFIVITMIAFQAFKRVWATYALGILFLLFSNIIVWRLLTDTVQKFISNWNHQIDTPQIHTKLFVALLFTALFAYLFYRFTFGLPSRRFYRVTQK